RPWRGFPPWHPESSSPRARRLSLLIAGTAPPSGRSAPIWSSRARLPLIFVVELGLQQCAKVRSPGAGALILGTHALHGFRLIGVILGFDGEIDGPVLAIDVDDHRSHRIAFFQVRANVLDAIASDLGSAKISLNVALEGDDRALGIERLHRARDDIALVVCGYVVRDR